MSWKFAQNYIRIRVTTNCIIPQIALVKVFLRIV